MMHIDLLTNIRIWGKKKVDLIVSLGILMYSFYFSVFTITRHNAFQTQLFDLSIFVQALWNTLQGDVMKVTAHPGVDNFMQIHFAPSMFLLVPLYAIWTSPISLLVIQSVTVASGAWPIYRLSSEHLQNKWMGAAFAYFYLLFPSIQAANLYDFHGITMAAPLLAWTWFFAKKNRWVAYAIVGIVAIGFREEAVLVMIVIGFLMALEKSTRKYGVITIGTCLIWGIVVYAVSFPGVEVDTVRALHFNERLGLGSSPTEALITLLQNPNTFWEQVSSPEKLLFIFRLFAPVGFLSIFSLPTLVIVLPLITFNLLSDYWPMYSPDQAHYNALLAPFIVLSASAGAKWLTKYLSRKTSFDRKFLSVLVIIYVFLLSIGYQSRLAHLPFSPNFSWPDVTERNRVGVEIARQIPKEASLSTQDHLAPHTSHRTDLYLFPTENDMDYIFLDENSLDSFTGDYKVFMKEVFFKTLADPNYIKVIDIDGFILLRRKEIK